MDKLTRESQEHNEIFESLALFQKSEDFFANEDIGKFKKYLDDYIPEHFKFEEEKLISQYGINPTKDQFRELIATTKEIIKVLGAHARKEDLKLFPVLKKYETDLNDL